MEDHIIVSPTVAYRRPFDQDDLRVLQELKQTKHEIFGFDGYIIIYRPGTQEG
jgi:hypothetical protein